MEQSNITDISDRSHQRIYSYDEINKLYDHQFEPRPFTDFEVQIFNGDIHIDNVNIYRTDMEKIYSLCNFFDVNENYVEYLKCVNILLENGDTRGYLKLSIYLLHVKNDPDGAMKVATVGSSKGNIYCTMNIASVYFHRGNMDMSLKYYMEAFNSGKDYVIPQIVFIFSKKNDMKMALKFMVAGILKEIPECMQFLEAIFEERDFLYYFLINLKATNFLIQQKLQELNRTLDESKMYDFRTKQLGILLPNGEILNSNLDTIIDFSDLIDKFKEEFKDSHPDVTDEDILDIIKDQINSFSK